MCFHKFSVNSGKNVQWLIYTLTSCNVFGNITFHRQYCHLVAEIQTNVKRETWYLILIIVTLILCDLETNCTNGAGFNFRINKNNIITCQCRPWLWCLKRLCVLVCFQGFTYIAPSVMEEMTKPWISVKDPRSPRKISGFSPRVVTR